jgi:tetratricopeptide (TPR) repeat protein
MTRPNFSIAVPALLGALLFSACSAGRVPTAPTAEGLVRQGVLALHRNDMEEADRSFRGALQLGRESQAGAFARDSLTEMHGMRLFPDVVGNCPAAGQQALSQAEEQFARKDFDSALSLYRTAIEHCPRSAVIRTAMADAHYARGDYEQAREDFRAALELDPWNRAAHRYLSDTEAKLGNSHAAWEEATLAVLSDPNYQMAWITLGERTGGGPKNLRRVRADKPYVTEDGALNVFVDGPDADKQSWLIYGLALKSLETAGKSHLEAERERIDLVFETRGNALATASGATAGFWDLMESAKAAGYLDEAIYVHLIDQSMAAEYAEFRSENRQRLIDYMRTLVSPPPASPGKGRA